MKVLFLALVLCAANAHASLILKGETELSEYNTTKAGQVLAKVDKVRSQVSLKPLAELKLVFKGYTKSDVCDLFGDSPNGEPEFAPCLKSHPVWSPEFKLEAPVLVTTKIEDITSQTTSTFTASLTGCIKNYDSLVSQVEVTAPPASVVVEKCEFIASSDFLKPSGQSAALGGADVVGTLLVMLDSKLKVGGVITNGQADARLSDDIKSASLSGSSFGSELIVEAKVKSRLGETVDLFNYGFGIRLE